MSILFYACTPNDGSFLNVEMCDACTPGAESALFQNHRRRHIAPAGCRCCETRTRRILSAGEERGGRRRRAKTKCTALSLRHSGRACRHCNHAHASRGIVGALQGNAWKSQAAHVPHQELELFSGLCIGVEILLHIFAGLRIPLHDI